MSDVFLFIFKILSLNSPTKYISVKDFLVSGETFDLEYNSDLELLKTVPAPPQEELSKYYESDAYISHTDEKKGLMQSLYQLVKTWSLKKKVSLIEKQNKGVGSLLDIGAGTGDFLVAAKNNNWKVFGMEPNSSARNLAKEKGLILESDINAFQNQKFDVVTLWHVLEHVPNLDEVVDQLSNLIKTGGTLIIAVPNFKSYDANYYKEFWAAYDVPRHLWHFSQTSIKKIFKSEFTHQKTLPMVFDSYYVSLLSEKYKTGNKFSVKAFWIGFKSNWLARKNKEYSSLIYCFRKV